MDLRLRDTKFLLSSTFTQYGSGFEPWLEIDQSMITNAADLQQEFVPADLIHRHYELAALSSHLRPIVHWSSDETVSIFGPSGTGRRTIARAIMDDLQRETMGVRIGYINYLSDYGGH